jgi:hypothetical protein
MLLRPAAVCPVSGVVFALAGCSVHPLGQGVGQHVAGNNWLWHCLLAWSQIAVDYECVIIPTYSGTCGHCLLVGRQSCRLRLRPLLLAGVAVALAATVTDTWQPCAGHGQ